MEATLEAREARLQETWRAIQAHSERNRASTDPRRRSVFGSAAVSSGTGGGDRGRQADGAPLRDLAVNSGRTLAAVGLREAVQRGPQRALAVVEDGVEGADHFLEEIGALLREAGGGGEVEDAAWKLLDQPGGWSKGEPSSMTSAQLLIAIGTWDASARPAAAAQQRAAVAEMELRRNSLIRREGAMQVHRAYWAFFVF